MIKDIQIVSGYAGSEVKFNVYDDKGERFVLPIEEVKKIILDKLNEGYTTSLTPGQKIYRIHSKI